MKVVRETANATWTGYGWYRAFNHIAVYNAPSYDEAQKAAEEFNGGPLNGSAWKSKDGSAWFFNF